MYKLVLMEAKTARVRTVVFLRRLIRYIIGAEIHIRHLKLLVDTTSMKESVCDKSEKRVGDEGGKEDGGKCGNYGTG